MWGDSGGYADGALSTGLVMLAIGKRAS
jgi:hypothetical protein